MFGWIRSAWRWQDSWSLWKSRCSNWGSWRALLIRTFAVAQVQAEATEAKGAGHCEPTLSQHGFGSCCPQSQEDYPPVLSGCYRNVNKVENWIPEANSDDGSWKPLPFSDLSSMSGSQHGMGRKVFMQRFSQLASSSQPVSKTIWHFKLFLPPLKRFWYIYGKKRNYTKHAEIKLQSPNLLVLNLGFGGSEDEGDGLLDYVKWHGTFHFISFSSECVHQLTRKLSIAGGWSCLQVLADFGRDSICNPASKARCCCCL